MATTDREALVALYDATDGSNWTTSTNWKTTAPLKDWSGVTAPAGDSVIILSLVYNNLSGIIPAQLGDLTNLRILRLADNQLTGSIPPELGNLTNLTRLVLDNNQLTGSIPVELGNLSNLTQLALDTDTGLCLAHDFLLTSFFATESGLSVCTEVFTLDFAHFANGDDITSDLVFVNVQTQPSGPPLSPFHQAIPPIRPVLYFYDKEGYLIAPESMVEVTGDLEITEDSGLTVQMDIEPLGVLTISTHGQGELVSGSVKVLSDGPIAGFVRYSVPGVGVAGVGASPPVSDAVFPARRQEGGISTAAAIHNLEEEATVVTCRLMSAGAVLEEVEIPLEANGQEAQFIEEMFTTADTSDFVGSVRCTAPGEGMFTGIGDGGIRR